MTEQAAFPRDQPALSSLEEWDDRIVARADRFYSLDVDRATATPLQLPGARDIVCLASRGSGKPVALCRDEGGLFLLARQDGRWERRELPEAVRRSDAYHQVAADPTAVVVISRQRGLVRLDADARDPVELLPPPEALTRAGAARHRLLSDGRLYLGFDHGEFGGGLWGVDVKSGEAEPVRFRGGEGRPVRCLKAGPDGRVWALEGLAHLGLRWGALHVRAGRTWQTYCNSTAGELVNWNLPPAALDALAFDAAGRLYVLSGSLGLARYDGGAWTRLTPDWPAYFHVQSLLVTPSGVAVVGTYDAGILLLDLRSGKIRRIALKA
jgi:hypothetical protein